MRVRVLLGAALTGFAAAPAFALQVVVISDLNGSYGSTDYSPEVTAAVSAIVDLNPDLVLIAGDMVAGQRTPVLPGDDIRAMWHAFHAVVTQPLAQAGIQMAVTPGNHDASAYPAFAEERSIFADEWRDRRPNVSFVSEDGYPFFYAFDVAGVRFVSLDATTVGPLPTKQMSALEQVLSDAGGVSIAFGHLPLWAFTEGREGDIIGDPELGDLFLKLGLDVHLSGHHHAFYPGAAGGVTYISQSGLSGGNRTLLSATGRGPLGFTVLDITPETGEIAIDFHAAPDFAPGFDMTTLPDRIDGSEATLVRIDLADLPDVRLETVK